jgi:hypothetical protein
MSRSRGDAGDLPFPTGVALRQIDQLTVLTTHQAVGRPGQASTLLAQRHDIGKDTAPVRHPRTARKHRAHGGSNRVIYRIDGDQSRNEWP